LPNAIEGAKTVDVCLAEGERLVDVIIQQQRRLVITQPNVGQIAADANGDFPRSINVRAKTQAFMLDEGGFQQGPIQGDFPRSLPYTASPSATTTRTRCLCRVRWHGLQSTSHFCSSANSCCVLPCLAIVEILSSFCSPSR